jgi:hypothetical protein
MGVRRYLAGALAVAGGILMFFSGYASRGFLYLALGYAEPRVSDFLSGAAANVAVLAITLLELVIALGGLAVVAGGVMIIAHHSTTGRLLIYLGGGAGFLGLIVSFGYSVYKLGGIDPVLSYLPYWVGLALAVTGRHVAKGS